MTNFSPHYLHRKGADECQRRSISSLPDSPLTPEKTGVPRLCFILPPDRALTAIHFSILKCACGKEMAGERTSRENYENLLFQIQNRAFGIERIPRRGPDVHVKEQPQSEQHSLLLYIRQYSS